jgi:hypothetical protein
VHVDAGTTSRPAHDVSPAAQNKNPTATRSDPGNQALSG